MFYKLKRYLKKDVYELSNLEQAIYFGICLILSIPTIVWIICLLHDLILYHLFDFNF